MTAGQKSRVAEGITRTLVHALGKRPGHIRVIVDEVEPEKRGFAGVVTIEYRRAQE